MDELVTKICKKCNQSKILLEFNKQSSMKDGYANICKTCKSKINKKRYNSPKFKKQEYIDNQKKWNNENKEKLHEYIDKYRQKLNNNSSPDEYPNF